MGRWGDASVGVLLLMVLGYLCGHLLIWLGGTNPF